MANKVLVIEADPALRRLLGELLEADGHVVLAAPDGAVGLRLWAREAPQLILLDAVLANQNGFDVLGRVRAGAGPAGRIPIIMLMTDSNVDQQLRHLGAGADDYMVKPPDPDLHQEELQARMRSLLVRFRGPEQEPDVPARPPTPDQEPDADQEPTSPSAPAASPALGRVLAFYGAKGGVGTTTLAINAAIALKRDLGRSVCLVDGNFQFGAHRVFLDLNRGSKSITDIVTAPGIDADLIRRVLVRYYSGVDLLLAPTSPEAADLIYSGALATIIGYLRSQYDYILIDVGPQLSESSIEMIESADLLFIVMTADLPCMHNVRLVLDTLGQIGHDPDRVRLVLNRSTASTGIRKDKAEGALGRPIDHVIVNDYRITADALNAGVPFMFTKPTSRIGRSVLAFAEATDAGPIPAAVRDGDGPTHLDPRSLLRRESAIWRRGWEPGQAATAGPAPSPTFGQGASGRPEARPADVEPTHEHPSIPWGPGWIDLGTGAGGPLLWERLLASEQARSHRNPQSVTVALIEIDGIDAVAEQWGRETAERLFMALAKAVAGEIRTSDQFVRLDRTMFAVLLVEADEILAINFIERARASCDKQGGDGRELVRVGFGWASPPPGGDLQAASALAAKRLAVELGRPTPTSPTPPPTPPSSTPTSPTPPSPTPAGPEVVEVSGQDLRGPSPV